MKKTLLQKIRYRIYEWFYDVWLMIGKKLYYLDMWDVRKYDEEK